MDTTGRTAFAPRLAIFPVMLLAFSACAPTLTRSGYDQRDLRKYSNCEVVIKKNAEFPPEAVRVVGAAKVSDTGFSTDCSEGDVLRMFRVEACQLNADVINIIREERPNFWSSCYRAEAQFLRFNQSYVLEEPADDPQYKAAAIERRMRSDQTRMTTLVVGGLISGFVLGLILF